MREREKGFTLIEVLFAIFIGVLLMGAAYIAMTSGQQTSAGVERKVAAQQDVRAAMQIMGLELSMASYNPHFMPNIWHDLPGGGTVLCQGLGNQDYKGIREATPTAITVQMDIGESNQAGDNQGEIIRYEYRSGQYMIRETVNCGNTRQPSAAFPFLGDRPNSGRPRNVRVINDDLGIVNGRNVPAVFRYFDGRNPANELFPTDTDRSPIPDIRRIDITLAVESDEVDPATKQRKKMTYSTSVLVRNHAF